MPFDAVNVCLRLWWAAVKRVLTFFLGRRSLKSDKSHFEFRLLSKRLPHSLDDIIVGCLATMLQQMSEWMNEWMNEWSWVEWVGVNSAAGGKWRWMHSDDNVFNSLQNVHLPCTELHLRHRQWHQRIPRALLRTPSSCWPQLHSSHSGSHVLHLQQRHFKLANQSNSCRRVSIFQTLERGLHVCILRDITFYKKKGSILKNVVNVWFKLPPPSFVLIYFRMIYLNFSLQFFAAAAALLSQVGNLNWIGLTAMAVQSTEGNPSGPC